MVCENYCLESPINFHIILSLSDFKLITYHIVEAVTENNNTFIQQQFFYFKHVSISNAYMLGHSFLLSGKYVKYVCQPF